MDGMEENLLDLHLGSNWNWSVSFTVPLFYNPRGALFTRLVGTRVNVMFKRGIL
jgi:hypothetical protein